MANTIMSDDAVKAGLDAMTNLIDAGTGAGDVVIYDTNDVALVTIGLQDPAHANSTIDGNAAKAVLNGTPSDSADADGDANYYEGRDGNGVVVIEGTCGASGSGAEMILNTVSIVTGATVTIESWDVFLPTQA